MATSTVLIQKTIQIPLYYRPVRCFVTKKREVDLTNRILTVPNVMSATRLLLAPVIGYMTVKGFFLPSLYTFAFASVLDLLDGWVARTFNQRSRLGTLIDPIADKTLMIVMATCMGYAGLIHAPVAAIIVGKDVLMALGFYTIAWRSGYKKPKEMISMIKSLEVKPSLLGKANTVLQMMLLIGGMCRPIWAIPGIQLFLPLEGIVSCTTIATLVSYALTTRKAINLTKNKESKPKDV